jgi:flavin reductase (DIM6/NTAB) family NADH-FMN oxidoreductase RutF
MTKTKTEFTSRDFRKAMAKFATGVTLVSTLDDAGRPHFMTANAFTSVCLEPPLVLICVAHSAHTHQYIDKRHVFGVNILSKEQQPLALFYSRPYQERHSNVNARHRTSTVGLPILDSTLAFLGCRVVSAYSHGDHTVYIGQVEEMEAATGEPLLFYESRYISL